ncbi:hypothetical protein LTR94_035302, partial [Friedmanniomyces endolithicus]
RRRRPVRVPPAYGRGPLQPGRAADVQQCRAGLERLAGLVATGRRRPEPAGAQRTLRPRRTHMERGSSRPKLPHPERDSGRSCGPDRARRLGPRRPDRLPAGRRAGAAARQLHRGPDPRRPGH